MSVINAFTLFFMVPAFVLAGYFLFSKGMAVGRKWGAVQEAMDLQYDLHPENYGRHPERIALIAFEVFLVAVLIESWVSAYLSREPVGFMMARLVFMILFVPILLGAGVLKSLRPNTGQWTWGICIGGVVCAAFWILGLE